MTKRVSLTEQAHSIILQHLKTGDIAIDATVGNGYDTLFLAQQVGIKGKVFGFDVQQQAIDSTRDRLKEGETLNNHQLFHCSHDMIGECIPTEFHGKINVIMFNLGYLPGSDKSIITQTESTLNALEQAIMILAKSGIITIAAYPGHAGGKAETDAITQWYSQLDSNLFTAQCINSSEQATAPRLFIIQKN